MECKFNIFKCVSKLQKTYFTSADLEGEKKSFSESIKRDTYEKWTEHREASSYVY